jgi:hypothetical protein
MTFTQLQDNVTRRLRAYGNLVWTADEIKEEINNGYSEFCRLTHIAQKQTEVTVAINTSQYALPSPTGVSVVLRIWRAEWDERVLGIMSTRTMDRSLGGTWRTATGSTLEYVMTDSEDRTKIRIYPIIDDSDNIGTLKLKVDYSYIPSDLSATTDTPAIPANYHLALVDYAVAQLQELPVQSKQNPGMGDRAMMSFWRYVGSAKYDTSVGLIHDYRSQVIPQVV